ncbi:DUF881 domain-containing protein [Nocardioides sp.]|uniref:DUF881 domain-containing protein n=1 Tax=Nocardioides sp. TaxID=35761 RepID=UPI002735FDE6|nr:DUF881 domain-containing protein [Nocardioides sp.]MDP3894703.1 DUF881 domain-containing protein [Nocardioides sp.]
MPEFTDPPAEPGPIDQVGARDRLRAAALRPSRAQLVVAVLLAVVGFAGITQVQSNQVDNTYAGYREQDLIDVLTGLSGTSQRAEREVERLERTRSELRSTTTARETAIEQARKEADVLSILAGLVPVTGPGIRIKIEEVEGRVSVDTLLDTIQELRTAGAEAMEFNDQVRLVAQSSIEEGVGGVYIDDTLITAPYFIDVIGEPHTLSGALTFARGPISAAESEGARVEVERPDAIDIESVRLPVRPEYAVPDDEQ